MKIFTPAAFTAFFLICISGSYAHEADIDTCGGHINKQTGEYHIHEYTQYRACLSREKATESARKKMIFACGSKTSCEEMANCKEVKFYFEKCGQTDLDPDKNGIPCDKLCQ